MMRNPDEAFLHGLEQQAMSLDHEIQRVEHYLTYLRSERGRLAEKMVEYRRKAGETR